MLSWMEARVTRLVNVFNYANIVEKEQPKLSVSLSFIDRRSRTVGMHFDCLVSCYVSNITFH